MYKRQVPDNSAYAGTATPVESAKAVVSLINFWNIIFSLLSREVYIMKLQVLKILTSMARLVNSISLYAVILIMYLYEKIRAKQLGEKTNNSNCIKRV